MFNKYKKNCLNKDKRLNNSGFTLIEILVTTVIIVIGLIGVLSLVTIIVKGNLHSKRVTTATVISQDKIENIFEMDYSSVSNDSGTDTAYNIDYYWVVNVQDDTPGTNTKTIAVDVYWGPAGTTSSHSIELQTILTKGTR